MDRRHAKRARFISVNNNGRGYSSQFENNYVTEMCSGSEAGSYLRLIDFVYHSTLGLRVIKKKKGGSYPARRTSMLASPFN